MMADLDHFFNWGGQWVYGVGYFWVKYLIGKYGKAKLLKLIKTINSKTTKSQFTADFKRIYRFGLNKASLNKIIGKS